MDTLFRWARLRRSHAPWWMALGMMAVGCVVLTLWPTSRGHAQHETPPLDIVLLVDRSSSMRQNDPTDMRIKGARLFVELMAAGDRVAVVEFSSGASQPEGQEGFTDNKLEAVTAIEALRNEFIPPLGNFTDMRKGLEVARDVLQHRDDPSRKAAVALFTDGAPCPATLSNVASAQERDRIVKAEKEEMKKLVGEFGNEGWAVYTLGLVTGNPEDPDPCARPDTEFLSDLASRTGGEFYEARTAAQVIDGYVEILTKIYKMAHLELDEGRTPPVNFWVPPSARSLFVISQGGDTKIDLSAPGTPSACPPGESLRSQVDDWGVLRQVDPCSGCWQAVSASEGVSVRFILISLEFAIRIELPKPKDEMSYPPGDVPVAAELVWLGGVKEGEAVDDETLRSDLSEVIFASAEDLGGLRVDRRQLQRVPDSARFEGSLTLSNPGDYQIHVEISGIPCEVAESLRPAGAQILVTVAQPLTTPSPTATPTSTATPVPPVAKEGEGGGLPWWVYGIIVLALVLFGLFGWWLASRILGQRPGPLEGTLSGRALPGGRVDLGELRKQRATLGGPGSDIVVAGINGGAAVLFTERQGTADVTMLEPSGRYDVHVVPWDRLSQFDLVGLAGLPAVGGATDVGREALIVLSDVGSEIARIEWRASSSF